MTNYQKMNNIWGNFQSLSEFSWREGQRSGMFELGGVWGVSSSAELFLPFLLWQFPQLYNLNGKTTTSRPTTPRSNLRGHEWRLIRHLSLRWCPCRSWYFLTYSGKLTINARGDIPLSHENDVQCYNHTLMTPFDCAPSVAIGTYPLS